LLTVLAATPYFCVTAPELKLTPRSRTAALHGGANLRLGVLASPLNDFVKLIERMTTAPVRCAAIVAARRMAVLPKRPDEAWLH
jgi:hypothetical protein